MTARAAADLKEGDMIDLEDDEFATMAGVDMSEQDREAHESTVSTFEFEYAEVESVELETAECVVVHTSLTSFAWAGQRWDDDLQGPRQGRGDLPRAP